MNSCLQEVLLQADLLKESIERYKNGTEVEMLNKVVDCYKSNGMNKVILSGMGSSQYAAYSVASYLTNHGIPALIYSAWELAHFQFGQIDDKTLLIVASQSGKTPECVELVEKAKKVTKVVTVFNKEGCPLEEMGDFTFNIKAGPEMSVTSKTFEITMFVFNCISHALTGELNESFFNEMEEVVAWIEDWNAHYEEYTQPMYDFIGDVTCYDYLANDTSLATAKQICMTLREGVKVPASSWENADYAHGQFHSAESGPGYFAQMFFPEFRYDLKEGKMLNIILNSNAKAMVYTASEMQPHENLYVVKLPRVSDCLMPLIESVAAETLMSWIYGPDWVKDH